MKKQYITPITELVDVNLQGSILQTQTLAMGGASDAARSMSTNETTFEMEQEEMLNLNSQPSLWDE